MGEVLLDAFIDSLKLLAVVLVCTFIIALIEPKLSEKIRLKGKLAPLIGVSISLLPQCGFSVVATDLYQKRHITVGTLIGVFLATSDEALPIFLSYPDKALHILPILALKFVLGIVFGYLLDVILIKNRHSVEHHLDHCGEQYKIRLMECDSAELVVTDDTQYKKACDCDECAVSECHHIDCYNTDHHCELDEHFQKHALSIQTIPCTEYGILHEYYHKHKDKIDTKAKLNRFVKTPILHSIEIFLYVLVVNIIFGIIFYYVGEEKIINFLLSNKYIAPLFSVVIGMIPNCVSSIVISELYIFGGLGFGATIGGLLMNAGVAFTFLFKDVKHIKRNLCILLTMFLISISMAYIFSFIFNFDVLHL